jgi:histidinol dehydrogenase
VPGGKAAYPSTVIMNAVPASVVEVPEILMATPPQPDGSVRPEVLMAARIAGVHRVFKMGGAQAIAAFAYGTATVPRVDKIVGPGNVYVQEAKRLVFGEVGIDSEAGPTEVVVVADRSATPAWVAADLLSQAEHDEMACAVLITHVKALVRACGAARAQLRSTSAKDRAQVAHGAIVSPGISGVLELANRYAPEHLVLRSRPPTRWKRCRTRARSSWGTTLRWRWATTWPGRTTCCPPAEPRASSRRSGWRTS